MGKKAKLTWKTIWIPVVAALLIWLLGFSPIWIIIAAGVGGYLYGRWMKDDGNGSSLNSSHHIGEVSQSERGA
jgi:chromate transport protein ChrA